MLKKVAVTGGLSCGKSSVCRFFNELGAHVVSADAIVHQLLLSPKSSLGQQVIALLGTDVVVNDQIDRGRIAKKVFNHPALLKSLEKLLHPAVKSEIDKQYKQVNTRGNVALFVAEIPLLFEVSAETGFDVVIVVQAPDEICRQRFKAATGYGDQEYDRRMAQQLDPAIKAQRADYLIQNTGNLDEMRQKVAQLYYKLVPSPD